MRPLLLALIVAVAPQAALAFCGFYVGGAGKDLYNHATQVVLMRDGNRTVLSMQNDYEGPTEDFALVVPVPVVPKKADVKTLPRDVFDRVDQLAAPRLVEYWEQDPCEQRVAFGGLGMVGTGRGGGGFGKGGLGGGPPLVTIEAQFSVGEYDIVVLGARQAAALETWLLEHGYKIPAKAEPLLRPYVASGSKFFVAKVNAKRVTFEKGRALLSPLRVTYEADALRLPVRLGLVNSGGEQDLIVHVLALDQRYEVANRPNATIPTNLEVADATREDFGGFYRALFDATRAANPGAVITEYAWQATNCDPCPGPVLSSTDLATLGADVLLPDVKVVGGALRLVPGNAKVQGALDRDIVRRVVRRHRRALEHCLAVTKAPQGKVELDFLIDAQGRVPKATAKLGPAHGPAQKCLAQRVERMVFPKPKGSMVKVAYPFVSRQGGVRGSFGGGGPLNRFVLTRLHARYGPGDDVEDLVFRAAPAIRGGRGTAMNQPTDAQPASANTFQGRYIIRHPWTGELACDNPVRGVWGGPPGGGSQKVAARPRTLGPTPAAPNLSALVPAGIPALGVKPAAP